MILVLITSIVLLTFSASLATGMIINAAMDEKRQQRRNQVKDKMKSFRKDKLIYNKDSVTFYYDGATFTIK